MAYPEIAFRLFHNNTEQFHLNAGSLKSRIVGLLGNRAEKNLVPVEEATDLLTIRGYIGKPEAAARTRGNQFFFVNKRFIRSPYLNHAVSAAFEGLINKEAFPYYVLFFELDPQRVDVNVHPSKQEVKFDDDRLLYAYLQAAVKHALAKFNIAPSLDFSLNPDIQNLESVRLPASDAQMEQAQNGYLQHTFSGAGQAHFIEGRDERRQWESQKAAFFDALPASGPKMATEELPTAQGPGEIPFETGNETRNTFLCWGEFLLTTVKSGFLLIHHKRALERIIHESLKRRIGNEKALIQQLLFPIPLSIAPNESHLLEEAMPFLKKTGYDINVFGPKAFVLQGAPSDIPAGNEQNILEDILGQIKREPALLKDPGKERLLIVMAKRMALSQPFSLQGAQAMMDELFACPQPQYAPDGKVIFQILPKEKLSSLL
jgi:DNA mismatch repair protein MutL